MFSIFKYYSDASKIIKKERLYIYSKNCMNYIHKSSFTSSILSNYYIYIILKISTCLPITPKAIDLYEVNFHNYLKKI